MRRPRAVRGGRLDGVATRSVTAWAAGAWGDELRLGGVQRADLGRDIGEAIVNGGDELGDVWHPRRVRNPTAARFLDDQETCLHHGVTPTDSYQGWLPPSAGSRSYSPMAGSARRAAKPSALNENGRQLVVVPASDRLAPSASAVRTPW